MSDGTPDDWNDEQNRVFSRLFAHMLDCQQAFVHPAAPLMPPEHWQTICWNASWVAADFMNPDTPLLVHLDGLHDDASIIGLETPHACH